MIVKNRTDAERWMKHDGKCGQAGSFCSRSCESHGMHVAIGNEGRIFAQSPLPQAEGPRLRLAAAA